MVPHLVKRFAGSLWPGGPTRRTEDWVAGWLLPGEQQLWRRMSGPDRRHAAGVARRVEATLPADRATRAVLAAALLHDVGKIESGLGTFARVGATLAGAAGARPRASAWSSLDGVRGRVGRYLRHAPIGAGLLVGAGSDPVTVAWAREHHLPPADWTVPTDQAVALKEADDD
jgi:hypothetical protein